MYPIGKILKNSPIHKPAEGNFEGLPIRASKKRTRLFIDNEYFVNGYTKIFHNSVLVVYGILAKYANQQTQTCFPSIDTIMREGSIGNRNTVIKALKMLEAYDIIFIKHSKGWFSNRYALLSAEVWKVPNSINVDTVFKAKKTRETITENKSQQYQNQPPNSIADDTGNHLNKSYNEIRDGIKISSNKTTDGQGDTVEQCLSKGTVIMLKGYYAEDDILKAETSLRETGEKVSFFTVKELLKRWVSENKITPIKEMGW